MDQIRADMYVYTTKKLYGVTKESRAHVALLIAVSSVLPALDSQAGLYAGGKR